MNKGHFQRKDIVRAGMGIALAIGCVIYGILVYGIGNDRLILEVNQTQRKKMF